MNERKTRSWTLAAIAGLVAAMAGGGIYATRSGGDNAGRDETPTAYRLPVVVDAVSAQSADAVKPTGRNPLSTGDMAAFVYKPAPEALPEVKFTDGAGAARTLADWKGKVVLLNLWATWCAPCRKEMPQLDKLQKELGSEKFEVVALSVDRTGIDGAKKFLDQIKTEKLAVYADATARAGAALKAIGMPTTLLIDHEGREIGRLIGPAEWDGEDAKRLIGAALRSSR